MSGIYTFITEGTITGARDRVLDALDALTAGNADTAIKYVEEFKELDGILKEYKEEQAKKKAAEAAKAE